MTPDVIGMLERMAQTGTAPDEGCSAFSVGFDGAVSRLQKVYIRRGFRRGSSAQKFVIGPYGSGKTHFLRHVLEVARQNECVTSEVSLNKDVDFTKTTVVFKEFCRELRAPREGSRLRGVRPLLEAIVERLRSEAVEAGDADALVGVWISGLDGLDLEARQYTRVLKSALERLAFDDLPDIDLHVRWLEGEWSDSKLAREIDAPVIKKDEENLFARRAMLSLFQFIRHAGFAGTVVAYDEAEQGLTTDKKKTDRILSMLQTDVNAVADLHDGSALIMFALTPDVIARMETFAALQQRISDPAADRTFFDGNTRAVRIDLRQRDAEADLQLIGRRLLELFLEAHADELDVEPEDLQASIDGIAEDVRVTEVGSGSRRAVAKRVAQYLLEVYDSEEYEGLSTSEDSIDEPEV